MIYYQPAAEVTKSTLRPFKIAWLFPENVLEKNPSDRLRRFQISHFIDTVAYSSSMNLFHYAQQGPDLKERLEDTDVIVLLNIGEIDLDICRYFRAKGKIVLFDHCERIFGLASEDLIMQEVSAITCCSTALAKTTDGYLKSRGIDQKIFVIRDPVDDGIFLPRDTLNPTKENTALIMGMGSNVQYVLPTLEEACRTAGYRIKIISEADYCFPGHESHVWVNNPSSPDFWIGHTNDCSVALCCHDEYRFPDKGNVKATMPMALGLPVIASPVESYKEAIHSGINGFIVENNDWVTPLEALKDREIAYIMGLKAQYTAKTLYSTEKISLDYIAMIQELQA